MTYSLRGVQRGRSFLVYAEPATCRCSLSMQSFLQHPDVFERGRHRQHMGVLKHILQGDFRSGREAILYMRIEWLGSRRMRCAVCEDPDAIDRELKPCPRKCLWRIHQLAAEVSLCVC